MLKRFIFATLEPLAYEKMPVGSMCTDIKLEITSAIECKSAGELLGLRWASTWGGGGDFPACIYADDGRKTVYFNTSPSPGRTNVNPRYSAICKTEGKISHF